MTNRDRRGVRTGPRALLRAALVLAAALAGLAGGAATAGARTLSDLNVPDRRKAVVEMARRIEKVAPLAPLPADLRQPFNPPGFEQPDPDERAASQAAARAAATAAAIEDSKAKASAPPTDHELLEALAAKVQPSGTIELGGTPLLLFGGKIVRIGAIFSVAYKGSSYDLELISIERTSFTLRLNRAEITRPIEPGKTP